MGNVTQKNLVNYIMDYEGGEISEEDMLALFQYLVDSGQAWTLQGHYGRTAADLIDAGLIHESTNKGENKMLTEKKKLPIMIQRLKKWKKWKGISKEDILKYGTRDEVKLLEAEDPFEVPVGDEQDQSLPEDEISLEDEQEAGTDGFAKIPVDKSLLEDVLQYLIDSEDETDEVIKLRIEVGDALGIADNDGFWG